MTYQSPSHLVNPLHDLALRFATPLTAQERWELRRDFDEALQALSVDAWLAGHRAAVVAAARTTTT